MTIFEQNMDSHGGKGLDINKVICTLYDLFFQKRFLIAAILKLIVPRSILRSVGWKTDVRSVDDVVYEN